MERFEEIEQAFIFGNRAIGNFKKGSDRDITIVGEQISLKTTAELHMWLNEESPLPYFFDVLHYEGITNEELKTHIDTSALKFIVVKRR